MQLLKKGLCLEPDHFYKWLDKLAVMTFLQVGGKILDLELFNIELTPNPLLTKTD